jgi:hypothetical protein
MRKSRIVAKARALDRQLAEALAELSVQRALSGWPSMQAIAEDIGPPGSVRTCLVSMGTAPGRGERHCAFARQ